MSANTNYYQPSERVTKRTTMIPNDCMSDKHMSWIDCPSSKCKHGGSVIIRNSVSGGYIDQNAYNHTEEVQRYLNDASHTEVGWNPNIAQLIGGKPQAGPHDQRGSTLIAMKKLPNDSSTSTARSLISKHLKIEYTGQSELDRYELSVYPVDLASPYDSVLSTRNGSGGKSTTSIKGLGKAVYQKLVPSKSTPSASHFDTLQYSPAPSTSTANRAPAANFSTSSYHNPTARSAGTTHQYLEPGQATNFNDFSISTTARGGGGGSGGYTNRSSAGKEKQQQAYGYSPGWYTDPQTGTPFYYDGSTTASTSASVSASARAGAAGGGTTTTSHPYNQGNEAYPQSPGGASYRTQTSYQPGQEDVLNLGGRFETSTINGREELADTQRLEIDGIPAWQDPNPPLPLQRTSRKDTGSSRHKSKSHRSHPHHPH